MGLLQLFLPQSCFGQPMSSALTSLKPRKLMLAAKWPNTLLLLFPYFGSYSPSVLQRCPAWPSSFHVTHRSQHTSCCRCQQRCSIITGGGTVYGLPCCAAGASPLGEGWLLTWQGRAGARLHPQPCAMPGGWIGRQWVPLFSVSHCCLGNEGGGCRHLFCVCFWWFQFWQKLYFIFCVFPLSLSDCVTPEGFLFLLGK